MCPRIPWELVTDPWGSAEHTLGTTGLTVSHLKIWHGSHTSVLRPSRRLYQQNHRFTVERSARLRMGLVHTTSIPDFMNIGKLFEI